MINKAHLLERIKRSAQRALNHQTPKTLEAFSYGLDERRNLICLRAHFLSQPTNDEIELMQVVETEIFTDFVDEFDTDLDIQILGASNMNPLPDGFAYIRDLS